MTNDNIHSPTFEAAVALAMAPSSGTFAAGPGRTRTVPTSDDNPIHHAIQTAISNQTWNHLAQVYTTTLSSVKMANFLVASTIDEQLNQGWMPDARATALMIGYGRDVENFMQRLNDVWKYHSHRAGPATDADDLGLSLELSQRYACLHDYYQATIVSLVRDICGSFPNMPQLAQAMAKVNADAILSSGQ